TELIRRTKPAWHGVELDRPDWGDESHTIALTVAMRREGIRLHVILNAYRESLDFALPPETGSADRPWRRWIDTALDSPDDIVPWDAAPSLSVARYRVAAYSVVVLFAVVGSRDGRDDAGAS